MVQILVSCCGENLSTYKGKENGVVHSSRLRSEPKSYSQTMVFDLKIKSHFCNFYILRTICNLQFSVNVVEMKNTCFMLDQGIAQKIGCLKVFSGNYHRSLAIFLFGFRIMAFMYQRFIYLLVSRGADPSIPSKQGDKQIYVLDALFRFLPINYSQKLFPPFRQQHLHLANLC